MSASDKSYLVTELVVQVAGYVVAGNKRVDKFALTSPVRFEVDQLREWLDELDANIRAAVAEREIRGAFAPPTKSPLA